MRSDLAVDCWVVTHCYWHRFFKLVTNIPSWYQRSVGSSALEKRTNTVATA